MPIGLAAVSRGPGTAEIPAPIAEFAASHATHPLHVALRHPGVQKLGLRGFVLVVVDGLGVSNLKARAGHAPFLSRADRQVVHTVTPSTTSAALTTLLTGELPGSHGLVGYHIRHPRLGLRKTLSEWQGIVAEDAWQRATPMTGLAAASGIRTTAIGRPALAHGGLTESVLAGANYVPAKTIEDRVAAARTILRQRDRDLMYIYFDELDGEGHHRGWEGSHWSQTLERIDRAIQDLSDSLPPDVGLVVTADHGMLDLPSDRQVVLEACSAWPEVADEISEIGGEPRFRSLYVPHADQAANVARALQESLGTTAWAVTREQVIAAGWFDGIDAEVAARLGEVIVIPRTHVTMVSAGDSADSLAMVGQHGGLSDEERRVPVLSLGALRGKRFGAMLGEVASHR